MKLVRSPPCRHVDDAARKPAVLRAQIICLNLEFLNGILGWNDSDHIQIRAISRHAVNQDLALTCLAPTNLKISERKWICTYRVARRRVTGRGLALWNHAWRHCRQCDRVAAVQGHLSHCSLFDDLPQGVRFRLQ